MWKFVCWGLGMVFAVLAIVSAVKAQDRFPQTNRCLINGAWVFCPPAEAPGKEKYPNKSWVLDSYTTDKPWEAAISVETRVYDTEGNCLFVTVALRHGDNIAVAQSVIPKTQLPKGAGCQ